MDKVIKDLLTKNTDISEQETIQIAESGPTLQAIIEEAL